MSEAHNYLQYAHKVLGVNYLVSNKKSLDDKVTIVFDKNLGVQEQLVLTKIVEAIKLTDFNSQVLPPGEDINQLIENLPCQKIICFLNESLHQHGVFEDGEKKTLFTHSIEDLVGPNTDKNLLERKKQTWTLLKSF